MSAYATNLIADTAKRERISLRSLGAVAVLGINDMPSGRIEFHSIMGRVPGLPHRRYADSVSALIAEIATNGLAVARESVPNMRRDVLVVRKPL